MLNEYKPTTSYIAIPRRMLYDKRLKFFDFAVYAVVMLAPGNTPVSKRECFEWFHSEDKKITNALKRLVKRGYLTQESEYPLDVVDWDADDICRDEYDKTIDLYLFDGRVRLRGE